MSDQDQEITVSEGTEGDATDPAYYTLFGGERETVELIKDRLGEEFPAYLEGTVIKYLMRWKKKNGIEDLKKARLYLGWLIEYLEDS